ncbi:hypothetical protein OH146_12200 [Salinibacterium sp. SYSU T00001]|uniref:hypothetical protein n=1 Tax=Homoserinimonas sedimenticola TaxID=2986805 RepID=UPI002236AD4F|nr:hypothetical protein [Salinibacterium sedimenticola]MCW4386535.1 hypothetical protein [Salinibacterium sedimenticola]
MERANDTVDDWRSIVERIEELGGNATDVLRRALIDRVPREQIAARVSLSTLEKGSAAPQDFEAWDALPPGTFDPRVVDQAQWWVDALRRPQRIDTLPAPYLWNIICFLTGEAGYFCTAYHQMHALTTPEDPHRWLERTSLMLAIRLAGRRDSELQCSCSSGKCLRDQVANPESATP